MSHVAYYRVSTGSQSIESQRAALSASGVTFAKEFADEGVSGAVPAAQRPQFAELLKYLREGDTLHVYAVDRLGRDAIDVQNTVRGLIREVTDGGKGVAVNVHGLGLIAPGVGELILAVLSQVADMERQRIAERTQAGRVLAKASLKETGRTHRGKVSMGRPALVDAAKVVAWREGQAASLSKTAKEFGVSVSTVKRYLRAVG